MVWAATLVDTHPAGLASGIACVGVLCVALMYGAAASATAWIVFGVLSLLACAVTWRAEGSLSTGWAELRNRDRGMSPEHPQSVGFSELPTLAAPERLRKALNDRQVRPDPTASCHYIPGKPIRPLRCGGGGHRQSG